MPDESSFHPPDTELEQRARQFAERATHILEELKKAEGSSASDSTPGIGLDAIVTDQDGLSKLVATLKALMPEPQESNRAAP